MLLCDLSDRWGNLNFYLVPLNTQYKLVGFIKQDERLKFLSKLDLGKIQSQEIIDKIEDMKEFLSKKTKIKKR